MPDDVTRADEPPGTLEAGPVASIHDPRALQILTAEHASLQSARSLAYNESFTRGGMFLAFMSTSFVDRKSTRLNSSHLTQSRMPSSA